MHTTPLTEHGPASSKPHRAGDASWTGGRATAPLLLLAALLTGAGIVLLLDRSPVGPSGAVAPGATAPAPHGGPASPRAGGSANDASGSTGAPSGAGEASAGAAGRSGDGYATIARDLMPAVVNISFLPVERKSVVYGKSGVASRTIIKQ